MQKLSLSEEEKMSRKEYLKIKKRQKRSMNGFFSKITSKKVIVSVLAILLLLYVCFEFYVYYKQNNYNYLSDEMVENQKVYNIYYMSEGYTYNPNSSLNSIKSNSFELTRIYTDLGFENISLVRGMILGLKEGILYSLNLEDQVITKLYDEKIEKYLVNGNEVYMIKADNRQLIKLVLDTKETVMFEKEDVAELLIDPNFVFMCVEETDKKILYRYNRDGTNKLQLTDEDQNVSYIVENDTYIFFVNKSDDDKVYKVDKEGNVSKISDDVKSVTDTGSIYAIDGSKYMFCQGNELYYINTADGSTLWMVNIETLENKKIVYAAIDILQNVEDTVFYKIKKERGLYLYNVKTGFNSQISSRLITEFVVEK